MKTKNSKPTTSIAIIGIGCIFAQSPDAQSYFRLLTRGINAIADPPETHRYLHDYYDPDPKKPDHIYCNRGGYLPKIDFDPTEFGIPPSSLEATDTSQLLGLVVAKQALSDAGYGESGQTFDRSKTSIILGVTGTQELVIPLGARLGHPIWRRALSDAGVDGTTAQEVIDRISDGYVSWQENSFPGLLGNVVAGRIANRLDLGGTNCVVDAACASSMSALHLAVLELISGRSDMVLTGGVDTINDAFMHTCFSKTQILSKSGEIKPFSKDADGTLLGEGVGMVVLKRLADAQRDKDRIYAVIKGVGSASDGKSQSIYAPRPSGQALALKRAYAQAGIEPGSIDLVEAHGTGTRVGDQVEFQALCDVFGGPSANGNRCALGTVKSNIGHTKAASGTAGLIKAAMALYHKVLPPTLKALPMDPNLNVEHSPFYINHSLRPWLASDGHIRRAGVSAFGFGGSNFHTVMEEYQPEKQSPSWDGSVELAAFSAATSQELADRVRQFAKEVSPDIPPQQIGYLCAKTRRQFNSDDGYRLVLVLTPVNDSVQVAKTCEEALARIGTKSSSKRAPGDNVFTDNGKPDGSIAFLFPGQGSQYVGMARDLICWLPTGLAAFQEAEHHFNDEISLSEYLYPRLHGDSAAFEERLRQTNVAQPAIGAASVALLQALTYFGIKPTAVCGHSYGELAALHAAGWIDRQTLWQLSVARGQYMADAGKGSGDPGSMLAVSAPVEELQALLQKRSDKVVLANRNSPTQGVLSGPTAAIEAMETQCREKGWKTVRLPVAAAFHSALVSDAQKPFQKIVNRIQLTPTDIQVMSNTTGKPYPRNVDKAKKALGRQLSQPVDFVANIEQLFKDGVHTFVEVGPKSVLTGLVSAILNGREFRAVAMDQSAGRDFGLIELARTLAQLAAAGYPVELTRWETERVEPHKQRMRIPLSGANYRVPKSARPKTASAQKVAEKKAPAAPLAVRPSVVPPQQQSQTVVEANPKVKKTTFQESHPPGSERGAMNSNDKNYLNQALAAVQQGLSSMQAMQAQTTQAHQKYLDAQAEASRTLQQMLHSTQQMTAAIFNGTPLEYPQPVRSATPQSIQKSLAPVSPPAAEPITSTAPIITPPAQQVPTIQKSPLTEQIKAPGSASGLIQQTLTEIVSELTGYPPEMLGLEMDIESDLGIDSIKRVEILSAMEDKLPNLPKITPDMVGTIKTLGDICDYLCQDSAGNTPSMSEPIKTAPPDSRPIYTASSRIQSVLVEIVSELTGYPQEMLGLEMDIESDLGIDSIKRVEILSALEDKLPDLPKVTPDMVGTLQTLGQICDYLSRDSDAADLPEQSKAGVSETSSVDISQIQSTLVQIVSELTGYPEQMLGLEMDIESDLGIDSIKRVEILSALEDKMPDLPKVTPDMVGTLKTLGQICDYLSQGGNNANSSVQNSPQVDLKVVQAPDASSEVVQTTLVQIVSELTGYPVDMLGLAMDIESDLGIDSIKRVEILSALEDKLPDLPKVTPDMVGSLKTLGQICDYLSNGQVTAPTSTARKADDFEAHEENPISRSQIQITPIHNRNSQRFLPAKDHKIGIVCSDDRLGQTLLKTLTAEGFQVELLITFESIAPDTALAGLVLIAPMTPLHAFEWAQACAPNLMQAAQTGHALFYTVSYLNGAFGFGKRPVANPEQGAMAGLAKTAALEWTSVCCKAIDVDPQWTDSQAISRALAEEIIQFSRDGIVEIGLGEDSVVSLTPTVTEQPNSGPLNLMADDVVVISGGARGVTAAAVKALSIQAPCRFALLGRSPQPEPEPDWLQGVYEEALMKKVILAHSQNQAPLTPKDLEKQYRRWTASREIQNVLMFFKEKKIEASYYTVDVCDAQSVQDAIKHIRKDMGAIKGLIHGAGILEDRLITDKKKDQFSKVYDTKVKGLKSLLDATQTDDLRHIVLFSSISARMGNYGQVDYAMANEVLNKTAIQIAQQRSQCNVISINWGPWDGGMVTPALKRNFQTNGIDLIPMNIGAAAMVTEMGISHANGDVEVVIGGPVHTIQSLESKDTSVSPVQKKPVVLRESLSQAAKREIDATHCPVLQSHQLDGRPVVPFALITEWLAHSALHANPGLVLQGIDNLRLLKGIILDEPKRTIRLMAGTPNRNNGVYEVDVEIRNGGRNGDSLIHSSAKAILSDRLPTPPPFKENGHFKTTKRVPSSKDIYNRILFHGDDLRGIKNIIRLSKKGMTAELLSAPAPGKWLDDPMRSRWIADPLVLDCAFQMAIIWCHEQMGVVSLPSYAASYRQYCDRFPKEGVTAVLEVIKATDRKLVADFTFLDKDKTIIAQMTGYEAVMDQGLFKAFGVKAA